MQHFSFIACTAFWSRCCDVGMTNKHFDRTFKIYIEYGNIPLSERSDNLSKCCVFKVHQYIINEPRHDKINKVTVRPTKTQISLDIRPVWSESSLSAWRKLGPLATYWVHSEDSDQTARMPRLIWVFAGRTVTLLVSSCRASNSISFFNWSWNKLPKLFVSIEFRVCSPSTNFFVLSFIISSVLRRSKVPMQLSKVWLIEWLIVKTSSVGLFIRTIWFYNRHLPKLFVSIEFRVCSPSTNIFCTFLHNFFCTAEIKSADAIIESVINWVVNCEKKFSNTFYQNNMIL